MKPMFGNLAAFVNGNMFMGLMGAEVGLRLGDEDRDVLLATAGAGRFGPEDRPMKEYAAMPAAWREDSASAEKWVAIALDHTAEMPPK